MTAKLLAEALADSVVALRLRSHAGPIRDELEDLLAPSLNWFQQHPNWPSGLSSQGVPVEFSVAIDQDGRASIRCLLDPADHRQGISGNWNLYLQYSRAVTGADLDRSSLLFQLHSKHLDGMSLLFGTPMGHAIAYGAEGTKRGSIYFNIRWLSPAQTKEKFPQAIRDLKQTLGQYFDPDMSRVIPAWQGYDFADDSGIPRRTKTYFWLYGAYSDQMIVDMAGYQPDLFAASAVFIDFMTKRVDIRPPNAILLEISANHRSDQVSRKKLHFSCAAWDLDHAGRLGELLDHLRNQFSVDLQALDVLLSVFTEYGCKLKPSFVSIGPGQTRPSVAFYFSPVLEERPRATPAGAKRAAARGDTGGSLEGYRSRRELIGGMLDRGLAFLLQMREGDGRWVDFALDGLDARWVDYPLTGQSSEWATAYITAVLARDPMLHADLAPASDWLSGRFRPGEGWGWNRDTPADADATALALLALRRLDVAWPEEAQGTLVRYRLPSGGYCAYTDWDLDHEHGLGAPEITALVLFVQMQASPAERPAISFINDAVINLVSQQRQDGGWNAFWWKDDLFATYRVLQALNTYVQQAGAGTIDAPAIVVRTVDEVVRVARPSISAQAVADEPFSLGLWLSSWCAAHGHVDYSSVDRILNRLQSLQQTDGRWLSGPSRRIAKTKLLRPWARSDAGKLYLDPNCLITTATVIEGLQALRSAMEALNLAKE